MKVKFLVPVFLFLNIFSAGAQKQGQPLIDSILRGLPQMKPDTLKVKALNSLSYEYTRIDVDEGIRYGNEALVLAEKLDWKKGIANAYRFLAINYINVSSFDTARHNLDQALKFYTAIDDAEGKAKIYGSYGNFYTMQGDRLKALEYHLRALSINEDLKDERTIAANLSNIAVIYFDIGRSKDAITMMLRAVELNKKFSNKTYLIINYHELARFYEATGAYDESFTYSKQSYYLAKELGDKLGMALGLDGMGFIEEHKKNYSRALGLYKEALQFRTELDDLLGIAGSMGTIGICYLAMSKEYPDKRKIYLDSTILYGKKGIEVAQQAASPEWMRINYSTLSEAQEMQGDYAASLASYKRAIKYQDFLFNADKRESIKNLEDKREIELRDKQLKINELEIGNRKKIQWLFVAGIAFLFLVGALLFRQNNIRKKNNKKLEALNAALLEANETKARFFGILNHDLRSPVSNLIQFLDIQKNAPDLLDDTTKQQMELQTRTGAQHLLQSMEDLLLWSKGQMNNFKPVIRPVTVAGLFENTRDHFYSTTTVQFEFENKEELVLHTDKNYLLTIMRNLTGNAIKALQQQPGALIQWKAAKRDGHIMLTISDNGPGIEACELKGLYDDKEVIGIQSGLGLHLIRDLAKAIDCTIEVNSEKGKGSVFTLSFQ